MEKIGPKLARKYLEANTTNRKIKKVHLRWLTTQMAEGKWRQETGEAIKFSKSGKLLDGQHRLAGIIESGKTFNFLVVRDLEDEAYAVIDSGVKRQSGDALYILGIPNAYALAAMIRAYAYIQNGDYETGKNVKTINSEDIIKLYEKEPERWQSFERKAGSLYVAFHRTVTQKFIGSWFKYFSEHAPEKAEEFFSKLCLGMNIKTTMDPVGVYRDWLLEMKMNKIRQKTKERNGYFILAWNAFIEGNKFRRQSWNETSDPVPKIVFPE